MPPGRLTQPNGRVHGRAHVSWENHLYAGENGLLTMLVTLRWWWDKLTEANGPGVDQEWMEALDDMYWVIEQVMTGIRYVFLIGFDRFFSHILSSERQMSDIDMNLDASMPIAKPLPKRTSLFLL